MGHYIAEVCVVKEIPVCWHLLLLHFWSVLAEFQFVWMLQACLLWYFHVSRHWHAETDYGLYCCSEIDQQPSASDCTGYLEHEETFRPSHRDTRNPDIRFTRRVRNIAQSDYQLRLVSVHPFAWNNSALTGRIFMKFGIWVSLKNILRKYKFHQNLTTITGTLHADRYTFLIISRSVLLRMRNVSHKRCKENQNTHLCQKNNGIVVKQLWELLTRNCPSEWLFPLDVTGRIFVHRWERERCVPGFGGETWEKDTNWETHA
jgi:hypothetical protein